MKLGVFTVLFGKLPFEAMLRKVAGFGLVCVELGTGAYPGSAHCDVERLLESKSAAREYLKRIRDAGLFISALSCPGNPIHPDKKIARQHHEAFERTVRLARQLEVPVINVLSGCPGDSPRAKCPNWITCAWPPEYPECLEWQWSQVVVPYWKAAAAFANRHGIKRIAVEMHPGFVVYNPETMLRLREAAGVAVGCNFDPSHMFWQGIDPCAAVRKLGDAVFHVHAKDTRLYDVNIKINGVLDAKPYSDEKNRSWIFRTVGYGHDADFWCDFVSTLQMVGYDDVLSIEHEDSLMSVDEGLSKAAAFLNQIVIKEKLKEMWWA